MVFNLNSVFSKFAKIDKQYSDIIEVVMPDRMLAQK